MSVPPRFLAAFMFFARASRLGYGNACDSMSKDSSQVDCREIEKAMEKTDKCVVAIERLDSDCLPRLSRKRENQFGKAKTAYDKCKEILAYKKDNKLCK